MSDVAHFPVSSQLRNSSACIHHHFTCNKRVLERFLQSWVSFFLPRSFHTIDVVYNDLLPHASTAAIAAQVERHHKHSVPHTTCTDNAVVFFIVQSDTCPAAACRAAPSSWLLILPTMEGAPLCPCRRARVLNVTTTLLVAASIAAGALRHRKGGGATSGGCVPSTCATVRQLSLSLMRRPRAVQMTKLHCRTYTQHNTIITTLMSSLDNSSNSSSTCSTRPGSTATAGPARGVG